MKGKGSPAQKRVSWQGKGLRKSKRCFKKKKTKGKEKSRTEGSIKRKRDRNQEVLKKQLQDNQTDAATKKRSTGLIKRMKFGRGKRQCQWIKDEKVKGPKKVCLPRVRNGSPRRQASGGKRQKGQHREKAEKKKHGPSSARQKKSG